MRPGEGGVGLGVVCGGGERRPREGAGERSPQRRRRRWRMQASPCASTRPAAVPVRPRHHGRQPRPPTPCPHPPVCSPRGGDAGLGQPPLPRVACAGSERSHAHVHRKARAVRRSCTSQAGRALAASDCRRRVPCPPPQPPQPPTPPTHSDQAVPHAVALGCAAQGGWVWEILTRGPLEARLNVPGWKSTCGAKGSPPQIPPGRGTAQPGPSHLQHAQEVKFPVQVDDKNVCCKGKRALSVGSAAPLASWPTLRQDPRQEAGCRPRPAAIPQQRRPRPSLRPARPPRSLSRMLCTAIWCRRRRGGRELG